jgi:hypothetical protein
VSDPNLDDGGEFFAQFLDDYFAECDEHLTLVRRHLLALEEQAGLGTEGGGGTLSRAGRFEVGRSSIGML